MGASKTVPACKRIVLVHDLAAGPRGTPVALTPFSAPGLAVALALDLEEHAAELVGGTDLVPRLADGLGVASRVGERGEGPGPQVPKICRRYFILQ